MRRLPKATFSRGFYPPRPSRFVIGLLRHIGKLYLRIGQGTRQVKIYNPRPLYDAFHSFYSGKARLLIVFRHVEVADGPVIMSALTVNLRRLTRSRLHRKRGGIDGPPLPKKPHSFFLYGKDVLNWAGAGARWAFPRLGGIPVVNTRLDRASHDAIRGAIVAGEHPLALAPEGQVTYQMFHVSELAAGVGTMTRWIEQDLAEEPQDIMILPIAIGYHLARDHESLIRNVLGRIYRVLGRHPDYSERASVEGSAGSSAEELFAATDLLLRWLEESYDRAYPSVAPSRGDREAGGADPDTLSRRIHNICQRILSVAELGSGGRDRSTLRRLFASRYRATDLLYREDVAPKRLSPLARAWANFRALDALTMDRHSQIIDVLMYVRPAYIAVSPSVHRRAEYALNLLDVTNRIAGGNIDSRYSPGGKRARLLVGEPINAGEILRKPGRSAKSAAGVLNQRVHDDFVELSLALERRMQREITPSEGERSA